MHRRHLRHLLERYLARYPDEKAVVSRFHDLLNRHPDCLLRTCVPGHVTGAAWILSADGNRCLLTHHRKLDRWLQLGGHVDGEPEIENAALREAQEESGMTAFELVRWNRELVPLDLDVHEIPAHGAEPAHLHYDVRFLMVAAPGQALRISDESHDLRWFSADEVNEATFEESVLRMHRKATSNHGEADRAATGLLNDDE